MPIYNAPILKIDAKETRRYAGLMRATDFDENLIEDACTDARLLAEPQGIWEIYDYDAALQKVLATPPFSIKGEKIGRHLASCEKVVIMAATVGEAIEDNVTSLFKAGEYAKSMLLDAAATTAVEQLADGMEKAIARAVSTYGQGYKMRWRFSPGYGDWPIEQQPELMRLSKAASIGISLSSAMMLMPRKSITAIIGLYKEEKSAAPPVHSPKGCLACTLINCPSRQTN